MSAPTVQQLQTKLEWANKRCKFAWAKFYTSMNERLEADFANYQRLEAPAPAVQDKDVPEHIKTMLKEMATELKKKWECPICLEFIEPGSLEITPCGHLFCKGCLDALKASQAAECKCPTCRRKLSS